MTETREGWAEASKEIAEAGDDKLVADEFQKEFNEEANHLIHLAKLFCDAQECKCEGFAMCWKCLFQYNLNHIEALNERMKLHVSEVDG